MPYISAVSISVKPRSMPDCNTKEENELVQRARGLVATYEEMADMIRLGAYRAGSSEEVDRAVALAPQIETLLNQGKQERGFAQQSFADLAALVGDEG